MLPEEVLAHSPGAGRRSAEGIRVCIVRKLVEMLQVEEEVAIAD